MTPAKLALLRELITANGGDAVFRPSSIDRVIVCPGSVVMSARVPKIKTKSTPAQLEGSVAHAVAESALKGERPPEDWVDRKLMINPEEGAFVDAEMADSVNNYYIPTVESREEPGTERFIERRLSLAPLDPTDPLLAENRGTGDCGIVNRRAKKVTIIDLKYGKGVTVPGDSPQLKDYALMTLVSIAVEGGWKEVETVVVQPRAFSEDQRVKAVSFSPADLLQDFLGKLVYAMETALEPDAPLHPSDKACRWCPAKDICPALADKALHMARDAFAAAPILSASSPMAVIPKPYQILPDTPSWEKKNAVDKGYAVLPSALQLTPEEISTLLDRFDLYDSFKKAVQQRAAQMLQAGVAVPGWTMEPRTGNRRWKADAATTSAALHQLGLGLKETELWETPKFKSVASVEKLLKGKEQKDKLAALVERPMGEPTMMRVNTEKAALLGPQTGTMMGPLTTP